MPNIATMKILPNVINAGTTFNLKFQLDKFPASEWSASLMMRGASNIDIVATSKENHFEFNISSNHTAKWVAGYYWCCLRISKNDIHHQVEENTVLIKQDLTQVSKAFDGRNHIQKVLDAIEAVIEGRANKDQESYAINNRQLKRTPIADLLKLRNCYKQELSQQLAVKKRGNSLLGRNIFVRLS
ncbi:MAG: hypothetical protein GY710_03405 [Desulfobacteraceae bacterium]|nr:hypothetical protein [Desulfobacteraceae bacterium]